MNYMLLRFPNKTELQINWTFRNTMQRRVWWRRPSINIRCTWFVWAIIRWSDLPPHPAMAVPRLAVIPSPSKGEQNTLVSWYVPVCLAFYCPWYQKIKLPQQRCKSNDILIKGVLAEQVCNIRILIKVASGSVKIAYVHYGWGQCSDHRWTRLCGTEIGSSHQYSGPHGCIQVFQSATCGVCLFY